MDFVVSESGEIYAGPIHCLGDSKISTKKRRRDVFPGSDPFAAPVGPLEKAHFKIRCLAVRTGVSIFAPAPHLPVVLLAAAEGTTSVRHVDRVIRNDLPAVPLIRIVAFQF